MLSVRQFDFWPSFCVAKPASCPIGAGAALSGYVNGGIKSFVAKVNLSRHSANAEQELEPLQLTFRSKDFMLPIQLGKLNGGGHQRGLSRIWLGHGLVRPLRRRSPDP